MLAGLWFSLLVLICVVPGQCKEPWAVWVRGVLLMYPGK